MNRRLILVVAFSLFLTACGGRRTPTPTPAPTVGPTERQLRTFDALWNAIDEHYVYEDFNGVDWKAVGEETRAEIERGLSDEEYIAAVRAAIGQLPEGLVVWETREERLESQQANTQSYEGIGAFVAVRAEPTPRLLLLAVMDGSPAQQAGLAAHDAIYAVDGEPVRAEEGLEVIQRVRGPAGSTVKLTVRSPGEPAREVEVTRGKVTTGAELFTGIVRGAPIAYFLVPPQAPDNMTETILGGLQSLSQRQRLEGIILDLRIARTGAQWPLSEMLTVLGDGELGKTYTRQGETPLAIAGQDFFGSQSLPLVILVGRDTEGAPEVLAGALRDSGRAKVVGMPTSGRVEGVSEIALPDGSRVFIASSSFVTQKGHDIGLEGVEPDSVIEADWDEVSAREDAVLDEAIRLIQGASSSQLN